MKTSSGSTIFSRTLFSIVRPLALIRTLVAGLCFLLFATAKTALASELIASVDRTEIGQQEVVVLQLRFNGRMGFSSPEWSVLEKDFEIVRQNRSTNISTVNGNMQTVTEWSITLSPKRLGQITIPAFRYKGSVSQPISIKVTASSQNNQQSNQEFYFKNSITQGPYYVQQQVIYTEQLFYTINHNNPVLSELDIDNARVELIQEPKPSIQVINGKRVGVYERRFAIFPEKSGELIIPAPTFRADIVNRRDFFGRGRLARAIGSTQKISVLPIPDSYPNAPWIPAQSLVISEQQDTATSQQWTLGQPITRTLTMQTTGLLANQVPAIPLLEVPQLRYYPEQSSEDNQVVDNGVISTVTQAVAIIPTEVGTIQLPEISVPWWNLETQKVEYAKVPAREIEIIDPNQISNDLSSGLSVDQNSNKSFLNDSINEMANESTTQSSNSANLLDSRLNENISPTPSWVIFTLTGFALVSLALNLVFLFRWRQGYQSDSSKRSVSTIDSSVNTATAEMSTKQFKKAIFNSDPQDLAKVLIKWGQDYYQSKGLVSTVQLAQQVKQSVLKQVLMDLDAEQYGHKYYSAGNNKAVGNKAINREQLWQAVNQEMKSNRKAQKINDKSVEDYQSLYQ